jgi:small subunit ribosomal protein S29
MPPRLQLRLLPIPRIATFSTTCQLKANPPKKKLSQSSAAPVKRTLKLSKKGFVKDSKPPAPGERKAFRKRLVLSNTNTVNAASLPNLSRHVQTQSGEVVAIPGPVVDSLRACGAFKVNQGWSNYRQPSFLVRDETIEIAAIMDQAGSSSNRRILYGGRKTGKSVMLLQAMTMAFQRDWIVISIPECKTSTQAFTCLIMKGRELTDAHTDYVPVQDGNPHEFIQNTQTTRMLSRIAEANQHILAKLKLSTPHDLPISYEPSSNLHQFALLGASAPDISWPIFTALLAELTFEGRPPLLIAADNISHLFVPTHYQVLDEPEKLRVVHPFDLLLVRFVVDYLTGMKSLPNGGLALGATSMSDVISCHPFEIGLKLAIARDSDSNADISQFWNKLEKIDERVLNQVLDLNLFKIRGIPKVQTRAMIEYWATNGLLRDAVSPSYINEKWTLSGGGVLGELESSLVSNSLRP